MSSNSKSAEQVIQICLDAFNQQRQASGYTQTLDAERKIDYARLTCEEFLQEAEQKKQRLWY